MYVRTREGLGQAVASIDVDRAVRLNRRYAQSLGWQAQRDRILLFLGLTPMTGPRAFAQAVAQWQRSQLGLAADGVIGPSTWRHLQAAMGWPPAEFPIQVKCPSTYKPGEIAKSRTSEGHLAPDVRLLRGGRLLIADFGVDWRHVKPSTKQETLLNDWLKTFETDPTYRLKIMGYTDCVGPEQRNAPLRKARAERVYDLLGSGAQSRVISKGAAPVDTYVADNSFIEGRAMNRGVVIEFSREIIVPPEQPITAKPPKRACDRSGKRHDSLLPWEKRLISMATFTGEELLSKVRLHFVRPRDSTEAGGISELHAVNSALDRGYDAITMGTDIWFNRVIDTSKRSKNRLMDLLLLIHEGEHVRQYLTVGKDRFFKEYVMEFVFKDYREILAERRAQLVEDSIEEFLGNHVELTMLIEACKDSAIFKLLKDNAKAYRGEYIKIMDQRAKSGGYGSDIKKEAESMQPL
jgi:hypothetical protein